MTYPFTLFKTVVLGILNVSQVFQYDMMSIFLPHQQPCPGSQHIFLVLTKTVVLYLALWILGK